MGWETRTPSLKYADRQEEIMHKTICALLTLFVAALGTADAAQLIDAGALLGREGFTPWDLAVLPNGTVRLLGSYAGSPRIIDINPDANDPLLGYTDFTGLLPGHGAVAYAISPNGQWIAGCGQSPASAPDGSGEPAVWSTTDPNNPIGLGFGPDALYNSGEAFGVSDDGVAVGAVAGFPFVCRSGNMEYLYTLSHQLLRMCHRAADISADGVKIVGVAPDADWMLQATLWEVNDPLPLEDPYRWWSFASAISPNGRYITGDIDTGGVLYGLALWSGDGALLSFVPNFTDGTLVGPSGLDVSDTGVVVGFTTFNAGRDKVGIIYKPAWDGIQTIKSWAMNEFGIDIQDCFWGRAIVSFDGHDYILSDGSRAQLLIVEADAPANPSPDPNDISPAPDTAIEP
jgi:hypothetical protein